MYLSEQILKWKESADFFMVFYIGGVVMRSMPKCSNPPPASDAVETISQQSQQYSQAWSLLQFFH